jgi:hypothetical protein
MLYGRMFSKRDETFNVEVEADDQMVQETRKAVKRKQNREMRGGKRLGNTQKSECIKINNMV